MNDVQATFNPAPGPLRKQLPKILFVLVTLATLGAAFLILAGRQGGKQELASESFRTCPERLAAEKLVPPPVPDTENFAATPFLAATLAKRGREDAQDWPDDFSRADQWPRRFPLMRDSVIGQKAGRLMTDLEAWRKAFEQSQSITGTNSDEIVVSDAPDRAANAKAASAVLAALRPYEPVLEELRNASRRPQARFNVQYDLDNPWATLLPQLAIIKRTCQLLRLQTSAQLAAGQSEAALRNSLLMLRLVDASRNEPTLISQLVRVACLHISLQSIWEGLAEGRWSEDQLRALQTEFQKFDFLTDLKFSMESERVWGNLTIAMVRDKRIPNFWLSLVGSNGKAEPWQEEADRAFLTCPRDWFDEEQRNFNRLFDERILNDLDVAARRVDPVLAEANSRVLENEMRDKKSLVRRHLIFANELLVAPGKAHLKLALAQASTDFVVIACACERHRLAQGSYPETLAALVPHFLERVPHDLVDGQPLRYERTADGSYRIYSVGWNATDEWGELAFLASGRGPESKEGDWVWHYPGRK